MTKPMTVWEAWIYLDIGRQIQLDVNKHTGIATGCNLRRHEGTIQYRWPFEASWITLNDRFNNTMLRTCKLVPIGQELK